MPKLTTLALPIVLIVTLALPATAQNDPTVVPESAAPFQRESGSSFEPIMSGPKRVRAPGLDADQALEDGGRDMPQPEMLAETEPADARASDDQARDAENAAGGATQNEIFPEGDVLAQQSEPSESETEDASAATEEAGTGPFVGDYTIGDPEAPVQVIEYASFTCPHCATFHVEAWPELKADFVDPGKIGFTLREVYFDRFGLWASMTARCGGEAAFYPMADLLLKKQAEWTGADDIGKAIAQIGRRAGLSDEQLKACLENQEFATMLVEDYQANATADEVRSTPTFIVRGADGEERVVGNAPEELRAAVEAAMGGS